jgi:hypothetical protein
MRHTSLVLRVALALTLTASPAAAQFTGVVAPPKARTTAAANAAAEATPGARSDSAGRTALSDMRAWVDSAAGVSAPAATKPDSTRNDSTAIPPSASAQVDPVQQPAASAADSTDGMRAPDTATMLPAVALAGLLMLGGGAWLLNRSARA